MKLLEGLLDHGVLQRAANNLSAAVFRGECDPAARGAVLATVKSKGKILDGFRDKPVGKAAKGAFSGELEGLPAGGPYHVSLAIADAPKERCAARDLLVGDLWIAAGQSNMQGCGWLRHPPKIDPLVRAFYMTDEWKPARDPIHDLWNAVDPVHVLLNGGVPHPIPDPRWGTGPAVPFAMAMRKSTGVPQGIVACAHGGTSMEQWDPARAPEEGTGCLYGALLRRLRKNGGKVAGMIWYQGCSDANPAAAALFTQRNRALVKALRKDCRNPTLPVVMVQIARVVDGADPDGEAAIAWESIREQQRLLPRRIRHLLVVPAIDLALEDNIHLCEADQHLLGWRIAQAMCSMTLGTKEAGPAPIELRRLATEPDFLGRLTILAEFDNVAGELTTGDGGPRPCGFELRGPVGHVFDVRLDGARAILRTDLGGTCVDGVSVVYGKGCDPVCNIGDEAMRSLPAFGPIPIGKPRAVETVRKALASDVLPGAGKLEKLAFPKPASRKGWSLRAIDDSAQAGFLNVREEIVKTAGRDGLVWFVVPLDVPEAMKLAFGLGYDGPVKAWLDGREIGADPDGVNPCVPWKTRSKALPVSKGRHELLVALGTNRAGAWGVMLSIERADVPPAVLRKRDPSLYRMPAVAL
ncbi:MAG: sialate O-acetylesterase [Kiritimatiellia bacterium]|jgi:hypothetical protein